MSYCLDPQFVISLNAQLVAPTGEPHLVLDMSKLESALFRPVVTWEGKYLHPTVLQRGAALLDGLCQAHAFQQGNKRTAWTASMTYLGIKGVRLATNDQDDVAAFVEGVVVHQYDLAGIVTWFTSRLI